MKTLLDGTAQFPYSTFLLSISHHKVVSHILCYKPRHTTRATAR